MKPGERIVVTQRSSAGLLKSLTMGNAVTVGCQLYQAHFRQYIGLALQAVLWALLPVWVLAPLGLLPSALLPGAIPRWVNLPTPLVLLVGLGLGLYGLARAWALAAAMSRLAYGQLTHQPESSQAAYQFTKQRMGPLLGLFLLMTLLAVVATTVGLIFSAIALGVVGVVLGALFGNYWERLGGNNPGLAILAALVILALFILSFTPLIWFLLRFFIVDVPLSLEAETTAVSSISRSWQLTARQVGRLFLLTSVLVLVTFPVQLAMQFLYLGLQLGIASITRDNSVFFSPSPAITALQGLFLVLSLGLNVLLLPLLQIVKTITYYDLRSRQEGLDLQLQPQPIVIGLNRVTLQTPESTELDFILAGIGNRSLALLIDYTVLFLTWAIFLLLLSQVAELLSDLLMQFTGTASGYETWVVAIIILVSYALYTGYFVLFETLWQGQTPGKRWVNIRVVREDGRPAGLTQATLRSLLRPIDDFSLGFVGQLFIMFTRREKRVGDWVAGTLVVQQERPLASGNFAVSPAAEQLVPRLLELADLSHLQPDDFARVREYLQRRQAIAPKARREVSLQLARQMKEIVLMAQVPAETTPEQFLEAIYLAYQQQGNEPV